MRADAVNRRQTTLEDANLKRAAVATAVLGLSGREMLAALLGGEADPAVRADLARGKLRATLPALRQALAGRGQRRTGAAPDGGSAGRGQRRTGAAPDGGSAGR